MSTPSRLASSVAWPSARTLKPMTMTSSASARSMSLLVIDPTPRWMTRSETSSLTSIFISASSSASTVPEFSPLMIRLSWRFSLSAASRSSRLIRLRICAFCALRMRAWRRSAICRATRSSSTTRKVSPVGVTGDDRVAGAQRAALDQDGRDRAAALVQLALDDHTLRVHLRVGAQVQRGVGGQQDRREQVVDALTGGRGDIDEHRVAAVLLGHQPVLGELLTDLGGVGPLLVDLVDGDHDRHRGGLGVVERLDRLRHDTVVGGHDQDDDVGHLRATGTHRGERLVTRGVDEGDRALLALQLGLDLVGADVLGDAAGLARHHVGVADGVQQLRLPVVDVTHDGHHRRTGLPVLLVALVTEGEVEGLEQLAVLDLGADHLDVPADLGTEQLQRLVVHRLRRGDHLAQVEQGGDQRGGLGADLLGEVGQRRTARQPDDLPVAPRQADAAHAGRRHLVELLAPLLLALAPTDRTTPAGTAEGTRGTGTGATTTPAAATAATGTETAAGGSAAAAPTTTGTEAAATTPGATPRA